MSFSNSIKTLRDEKFSDDDILEDVATLRPDLTESIKTLRKEGFKSKEILDDIGSLKLENKPYSKKLGKGASVVAGAIEGFAAPFALAQAAGGKIAPQMSNNFPTTSNREHDILSKDSKDLSFSDLMELSDSSDYPTSMFEISPKEQEGASPEASNPFGEVFRKLPESEDEFSRRLRIGTSAIVGSAPFGLTGVLSGIVGSQAGQTVREQFGKEGKFENFGVGEGAAIATDVLTGGLTTLGVGVAKNLPRAGTASTSPIFRRGDELLSRASAKATIQGEKNALEGVIRTAANEQVRSFDNSISQIGRNKYTQITNTDAAAIQRTTDGLFRSGQLNIISPVTTTAEQGTRIIQNAANETFQNEVINAERVAYTAARTAATGLSGEAPQTIALAKKLRDDLVKNNPTPEQQPVISFLTGLIDDLEHSVPGTPAQVSKLVDAAGNPLSRTAAVPASTQATTRLANDLVDLVQRSNQAVNYGNELRAQSHRLKPIVNKLREEVGQVLAQNTNAADLYKEANLLHGRNADVWGTRYMRKVRFAENPESLIVSTQLASNMRNLKQAIPNADVQALAERLVVEKMTQTGGQKANSVALSNLQPELSPNARLAANNLINVKDPLTNAGGRAVIRNAILKDASQAVTTGKRPEMILKLMETPKGYQLVKESLQASPQSRELFKSFERLFIEDIFLSAMDSHGVLDFGKAKTLIKNSDIRNVVKKIGGEELLQQFSTLEKMATNLERNKNLYTQPEVQSLFKRILGSATKSAMLGTMLHLLHVPIPVLAALGFTKLAVEATKASYKTIKNGILKNPRAFRILEQISNADSLKKLAEQLPRLMNELEVKEEKKKKD